MAWHQLKVASAADDPTALINRTFPTIFAAAGRPADMAIFMRHHAGGPDFTFYFAPGAYGLAKSVHAVPCEQPDKRGMSLVAGDVVSWSLLSP